MKLILIRGPPGAGKSTIALELAKKLKKCVVIPKDSIVYGFHFVNIKQDKHKSQAVINSSVNYYLKNKINVIVEGVFGGSTPMKKINELKKIALKNKAEFVLINLDVELKDAIKRNNKRDMSDYAVRKYYKHYYQKKIKGLTINTSELNKKEILNLLQSI